VFLGRSVSQTKSVSDETARKIDEVVRTILDRAYARTTEDPQGNLDKLHIMAEALLAYETIDATQIDAVMEGRARVRPRTGRRPGRTSKDQVGPAGGTLGGAAPQT
jgi:cell division protease FtsH